MLSQFYAGGYDFQVAGSSPRFALRVSRSRRQQTVELPIDRLQFRDESPLHPIETSIDSVKTCIDSVKTPIDSIETPIDSIETPVDSIETSVNSVETVID